MLKTTKSLISKSFPEDIIMPDDYLKVKVKSLSHVQLFATPWTVPLQAPLSIEFSRQEYQSGLPFPSPGDLPNSGIKLRFPALLADSLPTEPLGGLEVRIQGLHYHGRSSIPGGGTGIP